MGKHRKWILSVFALVTVLSLASIAGAIDYSFAPLNPSGLYDGYPATFLDKLVMPDYWQRDPAYGGLPANNAGSPGANYCVPTAMSNSIMWFDDNGYDYLVPNTADRKKDQFDLINVLDDPQYCNTGANTGSSVTDYVPGLQQWFDDNSAGQTQFGVKYQGLHYTGSLWTGDHAPQESWIKEELARCEDVILRVGWYELVGGSLYRMGGHGVTFVGYDDTNTSYNPGAVIIHDPDDGTAVVTHDNYSLSSIAINLGAPGVHNFMVIDNYGGADFAIIDGAIGASPIPYTIPEPCTLLLISCALTGMHVVRRIRKRH